VLHYGVELRDDHDGGRNKGMKPMRVRGFRALRSAKHAETGTVRQHFAHGRSKVVLPIAEASTSQSEEACGQKPQQPSQTKAAAREQAVPAREEAGGEWTKIARMNSARSS
jgi:hypothetical protein